MSGLLPGRTSSIAAARVPSGNSAGRSRPAASASNSCGKLMPDPASAAPAPAALSKRRRVIIVSALVRLLAAASWPHRGPCQGLTAEEMDERSNVPASNRRTAERHFAPPNTVVKSSSRHDGNESQQNEQRPATGPPFVWCYGLFLSRCGPCERTSSRSGISSLRAEKEQVVGVNELAPGNGRCFRGAVRTSCLETESQHMGIRAWIAEDHHHARY